MTNILLDTHIVLWLETGDARLRPDTLGAIETCWRNGGTVLLSAISAWEIAQLVYHGRIELIVPLDGWVDRFIDRPGIEIFPPTHRSAPRAYRLDGLEQSDPADRLLIATAIEQTCPLVTYDARITAFAQTLGSSYGFSTVG